VRITKDPKERKNELMDAAEQLFVEKGYEHTSASDIIRMVGVAQGTFYYYFESKDDILNAVIDRYTMRYVEFVRTIVDDDSMSALQKFQSMIDEFLSLKNRKKQFSKYLNIEEKVARHERFRGDMETSFSPLVLRIVKQGIREGVFDVDHPKETTELIVLIVDRLITNVRRIEDKKKRTLKAKAAAALIEKALGASKGSLRIRF
jgi:AcrR family transcriptional regulator